MFRIVRAAALSAMMAAAAPVICAAADTPEQAFATALRQSIGGPSRVDLADQATERLNEGYLYVPTEPGARLLEVANLTVPPDFLGLLLGPEGMQAPGVLRFVPSGLVDADAALAWSADDLFASLKDTVEHANAARVKANLAEQEARRWIMPPRYNRETHQIAWAALILPKSAPAESDGEITLHAIGFGRAGYVALSVTTGLQKAAEAERMADFFLAGLKFSPGAAYGDTVQADPRAATGLAGAMGMERLHKADTGGSFWSSDGIFPVAGGSVAAIGALALFLYVQRTMRREARRG